MSKKDKVRPANAARNAPAPVNLGLLQSIRVQNLLSFPTDAEPLELGNLNVLIGPNGAGKSNLLEAIALLRSTPLDLTTEIARGGGIGEWIWKGSPRQPGTIDAVLRDSARKQFRRHILAIRSEKQIARIADERIERVPSSGKPTDADVLYSFHGGKPVLRRSTNEIVYPKADRFDFGQSILSQRKDPEIYPEITSISASYQSIRLYRDWAFGRNTIFRQPQPADLRTDRLEEDFSNLGLFLNRLRRNPAAKEQILAQLRDLYAELTDFDVSIEGGTVQVFFTERSFTIPATRLSDGSVRYLCLLAILCDPEPPPLIGIEEPELGLHPDLLPKLADLLLEASRRCQLIITTHSDVLVDAFTETPESVVICEKENGKTAFRRLDPSELAPWLKKYRLGQLWTRGEIGGTRW